MPSFDLSVDEVLSTTRAVRRRLELTRAVDHSLLRECLELALQAPSPSDEQGWHFVVVTDESTRASLADLYRRGAEVRDLQGRWESLIESADSDMEAERHRRRAASGHVLNESLHRIPAFVIPCREGRPEGLDGAELAAFWAGIIPATWSFMLAARSRGLGTVLTTLHLVFEEEAAELLGIDYGAITQAALLPVAHTVGTAFRPAPRKALDQVLHWDRW